MQPRFEQALSAGGSALRASRAMFTGGRSARDGQGCASVKKNQAVGRRGGCSGRTGLLWRLFQKLTVCCVAKLKVGMPCG